MRQLLSIALFSVLSTTGADADTNWNSFKALKIIVADSVDTEGAVYFSGGHFLAAPSESEFYYLLTPKEYTVHRILKGDATTNGSPTVDLAQKTAYESIGVLMKENGGVYKWEDGGTRYALAAKPPLIGACTVDELHDHTTKYDVDIKAYTPDLLVMQDARGITTPTEFVVGFGMWCSTCAEWLPRFLKFVEETGNENFTVKLISINEDLDNPAELLERYAIDGVPSFIILQGDQEIGRVGPDAVEDDPDLVLEKAIVDIIVHN